MVLLKNTANDVAPLAKSVVYHKMKEVERKQAAMNKINKPNERSRNISLHMELIDEYLRGRESNNTLKSKSVNVSITPRSKRARQMAAVTPPETTGEDYISIPLPKNTATLQYTKPEAVEIIAARTKKKVLHKLN